jgi:uncharacterized protein (TIGR02594 family)
MAIARKELGVKETEGGPNERINRYLSVLGGHPGDAWCSAFLAFVMQKAGLPHSGSLAARSWLKWQMPTSQPRVGCVVVLSRGTQNWQGHVGLLVRESPKTLTLLSGNSADMVRISAYPRSRLLGMRWPT